VGELTVRGIWPRLLIAEGRRQEAIRALDDLIHDLDALRADHRDDLTLVAFVSDAYRTRAAITTGADRRRALLGSAAAWHAWPATTFTQREEQKDLRAAELPR
jgi:hypothetical protein